MAEHTPGPWRWGPNEDELVGRFDVTAIAGKEKSHICECSGNRRYGRKVSDDEALANARLVAAAPSMLAALRHAVCVLAALDTRDSNTGWRDMDATRVDQLLGEALLQAERAIACAERDEL